MRSASTRSYRSKLEVLRDFLRAAQEPAPKTRITGAANLNPVSFRRYLRVCTDRALITTVSGGYVATPRALPLLEAIDNLILKGGEVDQVFRVLGSHTLNGTAQYRNDGRPFRAVLREAWNEIALHPAGTAEGQRRSAPILARATLAPEAVRPARRSSSRAAVLKRSPRAPKQPSSPKKRRAAHRSGTTPSRSRARR